MQLRFILPHYTDDDATSSKAGVPEYGESIDIDGNGGAYEFATLQFEHQILNLKDDNLNAAYVLGFGNRTKALDTTLSSNDSFNHRGRVIVGGIKLDRPIFDGKAHWLANTGFRHYFDTDDLHPADKVDFTFADLKTAVVFAPVCKYFVPVLELTYLGDFDYNAIAIHPEVIIPFNENVSIKLGGTVGLSNDGNQGGGAASLAIGF
jgi:hypothetical protein